MGVKKHISLYWYFLIKNLRESASYNLDFWLCISTHIIRQTVGFLLLAIIYTTTASLNGWDYHQSLLLYGYALIPVGIEEFFLHNIWTLPGRYVRMGNLDRILMRPLNPLFHITADGTSLHGFVLIIYGIIVCIYASSAIHLRFTPITFLFMLVLTISGALIYFSITLIVATLSFWFVDVMSFMVLSENINQFMKYPLSIYPHALQIFLTWIVPYAFTSYFPAAFLIESADSPYAYFTPVIALLIFFGATRFFNFGLKHYNSPGG
jgi:ABC-2 type transport system permease protein